jgi:hypothetical protein
MSTVISPRRSRAALLVLAAAAAGLLAASPVGNATPSKAAANSVTFPDSTGEDPMAPDITTVTVSNDDKGNLTFVVNTPNRPTLTADMLFLLFIDSDANAATGDPTSLGADYALELDGPLGGSAGIGLFRWDGTDFTSQGVSQSSLVFSYANGPTIKLNAADLGATKRFNFGVFAVSGVALLPTGEPDFTNVHIDLAPDSGHGFYSYEVITTPPSLVVKSFSTRPLKPRGGSAYTAILVYARSDGATPSGAGAVTCRATVGGKALKASATTLVGTRATCTWAIPKTGKGKTIRGTITVQSGGLKTSRAFSARVV